MPIDKKLMIKTGQNRKRFSGYNLDVQSQDYIKRLKINKRELVMFTLFATILWMEYEAPFNVIIEFIFINLNNIEILVNNK